MGVLLSVYFFFGGKMGKGKLQPQVGGLWGEMKKEGQPATKLTVLGMTGFVT